MTIQKQFVLRYRDEGHLRFEIPAQFCDVETAKALTDALLLAEGVYRAQIYRSQKKLVIRYQETVCNFKSLAKVLFQIIADLEQKRQRDEQLLVMSTTQSKWNIKHKLGDKVKNLRVSKWFGEKYTDTKETMQAAKILTKVGLKKNKKLINDPEKAIIDFLNDVLVLFLIRLHWDHITKLWIPNPFKYRNEWAAMFYMLFLLMRSRKPKK
jgi:hypothetical protein